VGMDGTNPRHSIYQINCTIGVSQVVYCGWQALEIHPAIIGELQKRADEHGEVHVEQTDPVNPFQAGDLIKFKETSPLFGFLAEIKRVDKAGRLMVYLDKMMGASREIDVATSDVGQIVSRLQRKPIGGRKKPSPAIGGSLSRIGGDNGL
jgi:transcription antitermination factor NusG